MTFNSLIDVCVRCGEMNHAWSLFAEMQEATIQPDNFTYSTLIKGIKNFGGTDARGHFELEKAFRLLDQIKQRGTLKPDEILYNCLIDACVRFHDINRAVAVFNEMQMARIEPSSVTFGILIKAYG